MASLQRDIVIDPDPDNCSVINCRYASSVVVKRTDGSGSGSVEVWGWVGEWAELRFDRKDVELDLDLNTVEVAPDVVAKAGIIKLVGPAGKCDVLIL